MKNLKNKTADQIYVCSEKIQEEKTATAEEPAPCGQAGASPLGHRPHPEKTKNN